MKTNQKFDENKLENLSLIKGGATSYEVIDYDYEFEYEEFAAKGKVFGKTTYTDRHNMPRKDVKVFGITIKINPNEK